MTDAAAGGLTLTKYEAAGNDFLIALDPDGSFELRGPLARALCDRHRGIGADGVIRLGPTADGVDLSMELRNADGSSAETSGNGLRCAARAAVESGLAAPGRLRVATGAGIRTVVYEPAGGDGAGWARVEMGPVRLGPPAPFGPPAERARAVDVGNPHLVIVVPRLEAVAVAEEGRRRQDEVPGGVNVEFVVPAPEDGTVELAVYERGVGETLACGSGTVAAAAALRSWGLAGDTVRVHNPGGTLEVRLGSGGEAELSGPVRRVAEIRVAAEWLETQSPGPTAPAAAAGRP